MINYIRTDHIGRPVFATNSTGTKTWTASTLPFGEVRTTTGTPIALRFPGQWFQSESGLHQNWMRDYDPTTGRYVEADPLGLVDGASVYGYVKQNPGRWVDRRGLYTMGDAAASWHSRHNGRTQGSPSEYFDEWLRLESLNQKWLENLPECLCHVDPSENYDLGPRFDPLSKAGLAELQYHGPKVAWKSRSLPDSAGHGSQCSYDKAGNLLTSYPEAGSADFVSPATMWDWTGHYLNDVNTFEWARSLGRIPEYYSVRPVN